MSNGEVHVEFQSDSSGVSKLLAFLNTTRRQAELSISSLSATIDELQATLATRDDELKSLRNERTSLMTQLEQVRAENSKKWRLQERDDWRALVQTLQEDRDRLQQHCLTLELQLEDSNAHLHELEEYLKHQNSLLEELQEQQLKQQQQNHHQQQQTQHDTELLQHEHDHYQEFNIHVGNITPRSPGSPRHRSEDALESPSSQAMRMKLELQQAHNRVRMRCM